MNEAGRLDPVIETRRALLVTPAFVRTGFEPTAPLLFSAIGGALRRLMQLPGNGHCFAAGTVCYCACKRVGIDVERRRMGCGARVRLCFRGTATLLRGR